MSWCDKLASTPTIGLRMTQDFVPGEHILAGMAPILNENYENDRGTFDIEALDGFRLIFNTESGFRYIFDQASAAVSFNHRIKANPASAGPPTMELISKAAPYTELLGEVKDRMERAFKLIPSVSNRHITRVGIVSATNVDLEDAPPGIQALFEQIGKPLGGDVDHFSCAIATNIGCRDAFRDRCVHTLALPEPPKKLITVQLDWQRLFNNPVPATERNVVELMETAVQEALEYFERVAVGGLNDVDIGNG